MLDPDALRSSFPALDRTVSGRPAVYLDGPGGTQVHESVIRVMSDFMTRGGSNLHGPFISSRETDAVVASARGAVADLFRAHPSEIVFGQNMTSLTYALSRAMARTWRDGDNIVVTRLDHDANVAPWVQAALDAHVEVRFADFRPEEACMLDLEHLQLQLDDRTQLVAFTAASNAVGTLTPVADIVDMAHSVGAKSFVDAVHFTPHGLVDVADLDTDFLVASAYKWFGPHTGCLFGKRNHLESIRPYKLRPSPDTAPDRWETGTQSFESLAGVTAAVDYLASLGSGDTRRARLASAYDAITTYEATLSARFIGGLAEIPGVTLVGHQTSGDRTPTFAIDVDGRSPHQVAAELGRAGCFVWAGDYYAFEVMQRLDRPDGLVRIGFVHYNTIEEVDTVLDLLASLG